MSYRPATPPTLSWIPSTIYIVSISLAIIAGISACKPPREDGNAEAYVENGEVWAWGSVQLTGIDVPASLKVEKVEISTQTPSSDQSLDTRQTAYRIYGAIEARTGGRGLRDLAYVDYHPNEDKLLAYAYKVEWREDRRQRGRIRLYAVLRKAGRSYHRHRKIYLGDADFAKDAKVTQLRLAQGVQLSMIAYGVYAGQWALHYADAKHIVVSPYQGQCPRVSQMPGQAPNQNPSQFKTCRPIPSQVDLCGGDPTKKGCRPKLPQTPRQGIPGDDPGQTLPIPRTRGLQVVTGETRVFTMEPGEKQAKIIFISSSIETDEAGNRGLCGQGFFAVARTVGSQINDACRLKAAPAKVVEGHMACALTVTFENPQTYMDRVCNVTASFRQNGETQIVQILKK